MALIKKYVVLTPHHKMSCLWSYLKNIKWSQLFKEESVLALKLQHKHALLPVSKESGPCNVVS